jgi:hypothetical protein
MHNVSELTAFATSIDQLRQPGQPPPEACDRSGISRRQSAQTAIQIDEQATPESCTSGLMSVSWRDDPFPR